MPPNYEARILLIAGGTPTGNDAIPDVEMVDFSELHPEYRPIQTSEASAILRIPCITTR